MKIHGSYGAKYTTNLYHHDKLTKFQCSKCRISFLDETGLKRHLVSHKENIQFKCDNCGKAFIQMENLKIHKQCHVGAKNLVCPKWNEIPISKKAMEDHLPAKAADKPVEMTNCYKCGKMFAQGIALIKHAMSHA